MKRANGGGRSASWIDTMWVILVAMLAASLLILVVGQSPLRVYGLMLSRSWGDRFSLGQVIFRATPLVFTGLAVAIAFHGGLFNIGAEGQLLLGSFACGVVGAALPAWVPPGVGQLVTLVAAAAAGAALAGLAGALKARFGAHEVITTIMLNVIAGAIVLWIGRNGLFVEQTLHTRAVAEGARLPGLDFLFGRGTAASAAFLLAIAAAAGTHVLVTRTGFGLSLRAVGLGPAAAQTAGISTTRMTVAAMALSGAASGLVASGTVLGHDGWFESGQAVGTGFMGIAVALLARNRPLWIIPAALLLGTIAQGGLGANALVPKEIVEVIEGVIILAAAWSNRP